MFLITTLYGNPFPQLPLPRRKSDNDIILLNDLSKLVFNPITKSVFPLSETISRSHTY